MKNNLILIEGIPGSGKSTMAIRIKEYLVKQNKRVKLYSEGDYHPADLAWNSYLSKNEYDNLLSKYPEIKEQAVKLTVVEDNHYIVPYTKLRPEKNASNVFNDFAKYEIYDGKISLNKFKDISLKRWEKFGENAKNDEIVIFECAYLQNQINELLGNNNQDEKEILSYMRELINKVKVLNPIIIYLSQESVYSTISKVAMERVSPKADGLDWIDNVITWIEKSSYGKKYNLEGFEGVITYFEARKKFELKVLNQLPVESEIIENKDYNWEKVFADIINILENKK